MDEDLARREPDDLIGRDSAVCAADPEIGRALLLGESIEEERVFFSHFFGPAAIVVEQVLEFFHFVEAFDPVRGSSRKARSSGNYPVTDQTVHTCLLVKSNVQPLRWKTRKPRRPGMSFRWRVRFLDAATQSRASVSQRNRNRSFSALAGRPFLLECQLTSVPPMNRVGLWGRALAVICVLAIAETVYGAPGDLAEKANSKEGVPTLVEASDEEKAVLYTIGPGPTMFERWGHSLLCFQPASAFSSNGALVSPEAPDSELVIDTSCFDFGVFPRASLAFIVSESLRGEPLFVPQEIAYQNAVGRYFWLDRTIERQVLPLDTAEVFDLRDRLSDVVLAAEGYAYHPFYNNCATQLRDVVDEFSGNALKGDEGKRDGPTLREFAKQGFTGRMLSLLGLELLIGGSADQKTTAWERAGFSEGLKALVLQRFGVKAHVVYAQSWKPPPTSVHAGRALLFLLCVSLSGGLLWARRRHGGADGVQWRVCVGIYAALIALVGLLALGLRFYSSYPEFATNWAPVVFLPFDAALPWLGASLRKHYVVGRLASLVLLGALALFSILSQPLVGMALFVGIPLGLMGFFWFQEKTGDHGPLIHR